MDLNLADKFRSGLGKFSTPGEDDRLFVWTYVTTCSTPG
eukprot:SAG31_NODE_42194_length_272_cov_1.416185_1_plen_38_part_10